MDLILGDKKITNIELVIFDKDGTLIDLWTYWSNIIRYRANMIIHRLGLDSSERDHLMYAMGVDMSTNKIRKDGPVGVKSREVVLESVVEYLKGIGIKNSTQTCNTVFNEVNRVSENMLYNIVKVIPGSRELLNDITCMTAIATTDTTERAKFVMSSALLKFDFIAGSDLVKNPKPDPEIIDRICDYLTVDKFETVIIGDTLSDIICGHRANVKASIGVLSGIGSRKELSSETEYIVNSVKDIKVENVDGYEINY